MLVLSHYFCNFVSIVGFYKDAFKSLVSKHAKLQHTNILTIQHMLLKVPLHVCSQDTLHSKSHDAYQLCTCEELCIT